MGSGCWRAVISWKQEDSNGAWAAPGSSGCWLKVFPEALSLGAWGGAGARGVG